MPQDQIIELPDGTQVPKSVWDSASPELQTQVFQKSQANKFKSQGQNPTTQGAFNSINDFTTRILQSAMSPMGASPGVFDTSKPPSDAVNRLKWAAPAAGYGMMTGGPAGAVLNGASVAAAPPRTPGDVATTAASMAIGPKVGGWVESKIAEMPWLAKLLARSGAGVTNTVGNAIIKKAFGEDADTSTTSMALGAVLPALMGLPMDRMRKNVNVTDAIREATGNPQVTTANAPQAGQQLQQAAAPQVQTLGDYIKADLNAAKNQLATLKQKAQDLADQKAEFAVTASKNDAEYQARKAVFDRQQADLKNQIDALTKKTAQVGTRTDLNTGQQTPVSYLDQEQQSLDYIDKLKRQQSIAKTGRDPNNPANDLSPLTKQDMVDHYQQQIDAAQQSLVQNKLSRLQKIAETKAQQQGLVAPEEPDTAGNRIKIKQMDKELVQNRNSINQLKDSINSPAESFNIAPQLLTIFDSKNTPEETMRAITAADPSTLTKLMDHADTMKNGDKIKKSIQNIFIGQLFKDAYDPTSKDFGKINSLRDATGPFNVEKMAVVFGDQDKARRFNSLINDIHTLTDKNTTSNITNRFAKIEAVAAPLSLLFHVPHWQAFTVASVGSAGAAVASVKMTSLVDKLLSDPKLYDTFHTWVQNGATAQALQVQPALQRLFKSFPSM